MRPIRAGIIGAGLMGRWHGEALRRAGGRLTSVLDPDPAAASRLARRHAGAAVYPDLDSLLSESRVDVLHVCSPPETHGPMIARAIGAGLNVLVEKPLAATAAETAELLEQAEARGVLLCPVHQFLFQDGVRRIHAALSPIRPLRHLEVVVCTAGGAGRPDAERDRLLAEILPHPLSLAQAFVPGGLDRVGWHAWQPGAGELVVHGAAEGFSIRFLVSLGARPTECSLVLRGEGGSIRADLFHGYSLREGDRVSRYRKLTHPFALALQTCLVAAANLATRAARWEPAYPGLSALVREFYEAVRSGGGSPILPRDALRVAAARDVLVSALDPHGSPGRVPGQGHS